jgi:NADH-quinone oxidoreductase subunit C
MPDEERTPSRHEGARENVNERPPAPDDPAPDDVVGAAALEAFPGTVFVESHGQPVIHVARERWRDVGSWLRDEQGFEMCVDICAVDHLLNAQRSVPPGVTPHRFEVAANFLSLAKRRRIRAVAHVPGPTSEEPTPRIESLVPVYPGVDYSERETYDLFGIVFDDHPDLDRILLPEDWEGHPLRKDDGAARVPLKFKGAGRPR